MVGLILALAGVARWAEIAADIGAALRAPWQRDLIPVFQQSPRSKLIGKLACEGKRKVERWIIQRPTLKRTHII